MLTISYDARLGGHTVKARTLQTGLNTLSKQLGAAAYRVIYKGQSGDTLRYQVTLASASGAVRQIGAVDVTDESAL